MKNLKDINYWKTKEKLIDWVYEYKPKELNFHFDYIEFKSLNSAVLDDFVVICNAYAFSKGITLKEHLEMSYKNYNPRIEDDEKYYYIIRKDTHNSSYIQFPGKFCTTLILNLLFEENVVDRLFCYGVTIFRLDLKFVMPLEKICCCSKLARRVFDLKLKILNYFSKMNWENLLVPELICGEKGVTLYLKPKRNLNLCLQRFYLRYDETTYSLELEMKGKTNLERINNILVQKDKKQLLKTCFEVFLDHLNYWPSSDVWIKKIRKNSLLFEQWLKEYGNNFIFGVVLCENTFLKQEGVMDKTKKICRMTKNWNTTLGFLEVEESNVYALLFVLLLSLKCEKKEINKLIIEESVLLQRLNLINSEKNRRTLRENFNVLVSLRVGTVSRKKMRSAILIYDFKVEKLEKKTIYSLNFYDEAVNLISRTNKLLKVDIFESLDNWRKTKKLKIRKNTLLTLFLEMLSSTMMSKMSKKSLPPDYRTTKNYFEIIEELSTDFLPSVLNIEIPKIEKRNLERIVINFQNTKYIFPKQPEE